MSRSTISEILTRDLGIRLLWTIFMVSLVAGSPVSGSDEGTGPADFIFFNLDRDRIREASFLETDAVVGAQLKYTWRELEPERDRYEFRSLIEDLKFLAEHDKRLFVQVQDVSFSEDVNVPDYLLTPEFGGGVARKYEFENDDEKKVHFDGWVARRWDPAVIDRFARLFDALGKELDDRVEGINLAETSIGFGETGALHPKGYTYESYANGVRAIMSAAKAAFPHSQVIQYANFMPGEALPHDDHGYLRSIYGHAEEIGAGVGGPDLLPHRRWQRVHSYKLISARGPRVVAGLAVQWGNLEDTNPETGERVTPAELRDYARDVLRLDYVFWGTQEPYYSSQVLPYLRGVSGVDRR